MLEEKSRTELGKYFRAEWFSRSALIKALIAVSLTAALALLFPRGESIDLDYKVGTVWARKDLIAPFSFPIFRDEREYAHDVGEAKKNVYDVFERDSAATEAQPAALDAFFARLQDALELRAQIHRGAHKHSAADSIRFNDLASSLDIPFSDTDWDVLSALASSGRLKDMRAAMERWHGNTRTRGSSTRRRPRSRAQISRCAGEHRRKSSPSPGSWMKTISTPFSRRN